MPGTGGTPIATFFSTTPGTVPTAGQLVNGELFINIADGKIFYKNAGGAVKLLGAGIAWIGAQTSNFSAVAQTGYPVNTTSGAITALLPATPSAGDAISFIDYAGTFQTHALTIDPNGGKINGATGTISINTPRAAIDLVYVDATQGWVAYAGFATSPLGSYACTYLVVGGGAGGGYADGGGGAGGGVLTGSLTLIPGMSVTVAIGSGGAAAVSSASVGSNGGNTSISFSGFSVTALGGGGGASYGTNRFGASGSSGGGGSVANGLAGLAGSGTVGQGYAGGLGNGDGANYANGGGGGGAGAVGGLANYSTVGGVGGAGLASSISGASVSYGGGGGGGTGNVTTTVAGGAGGGGAGASTNTAAVAGTANSGGGGGGGGASGAYSTGAAGGSGVVILSYLGAQRFTGGTYSTSGGYSIHTFTTGVTFTS